MISIGKRFRMTKEQTYDFFKSLNRKHFSHYIYHRKPETAYGVPELKKEYVLFKLHKEMIVFLDC